MSLWKQTFKTPIIAYHAIHCTRVSGRIPIEKNRGSLYCRYSIVFKLSWRNGYETCHLKTIKNVAETFIQHPLQSTAHCLRQILLQVHVPSRLHRNKRIQSVKDPKTNGNHHEATIVQSWYSIAKGLLWREREIIYRVTLLPRRPKRRNTQAKIIWYL